MSAKLIYGFEIGVPGNWKVIEAQLDETNQRPLLITPWYNDTDHYPNFREMAWDQMFSAIPNAPAASTPAQRESIARSYYSVHFEDIGSQGNENVVLATLDLRYETEGSEPEAVNPGALQSRPISGRYSEKLRRALNALGLTPVQPHAQWLLTEYDPTTT